MSRMVCVFTAQAATCLETLSLHDALPIWRRRGGRRRCRFGRGRRSDRLGGRERLGGLELHLLLDLVARLDVEVEVLGFVDRKSTRLNSSHGYISYAVFCLKKKNHPEVGSG